MNFKEAATDIEALEQEFIKLRDDLSQAAVKNAKTKCTVWGVQVDRQLGNVRDAWRTEKRCRAFTRRSCARYEECI